MAVGAYFDLTDDVGSPLSGGGGGGGGSMIWTYSMSLVDDISSSDDVSVPPNTKFIKRWRVRNSGTSDWPNGTHLKFRSGQTNMCSTDHVLIQQPQVQVK